jgi:fatty-acyl-CoA synthase
MTRQRLLGEAPPLAPSSGATTIHVVEDDEQARALAEQLLEHCRAHLARFKCPREIRFAELPKTSTGKLQKHLLRAQVKSSSAIG